MSGCLGSVLAALVDGELDHAAREKAHRHLAHCAACRAEVDGQRRLKAALTRVAPADPSSALLARLHGLAQSPPPAPVPPARRPAPPAPRPAPVPSSPWVPALPPVASRSSAVAAPSSRPVAGRPAGRTSTVRSRPAVLPRRAAAGSAFAVLGVAAALALAAPPQRPVVTPPGAPSGVLVTEVASTSGAGSSGLLGQGVASVTAVRAATIDQSRSERPAVPVRAAVLSRGRPAR